ncbi:methionine synthase [Nakamurella sp. YIM 132087]|uniref:Methionine synthase n=1 Tax=Nakamurella alba TaxID=2665158 RepID=A0A7K1FJH3_9ACTN|nr:methionine synthase [Nakamurella alba]MTD13024.1 methionine synthase [Nakamurella alba]
MTDRAWSSGGVATGVGSLPGTSADEAARTVAGELPDLPHLAELPGRGAGADMIGRAVGLLVDVYGEVVPSGWRISRRPGRDVQRAQDYLAWDLDAAEQHYAGAAWVKVQVCGPWTLAAGIELPSGNRALLDLGAVTDLSASLAEGLTQQLTELTRRLPGTRFVVQVDEPGLPAVLAGSLPTASGFGTVRSIDRATAGPVLQDFVSAIGEHPVVAHCCHPQIPIDLLRAAGVQAISLDVTALGSSAGRLDPVGEALEAGTVLLAGLLPGVAPVGPAVPLRQWAGPLLDLWNRLGLPRKDLAGVVPTPTCGLAGAAPEWARTAMHTVAELGRALQDLPEGW